MLLPSFIEGIKSREEVFAACIMDLPQGCRLLGQCWVIQSR